MRRNPSRGDARDMDVDSLIGREGVASHLLPEIYPFNLQINAFQKKIFQSKPFRKNANPFKSLRRRDTINRLNGIVPFFYRITLIFRIVIGCYS